MFKICSKILAFFGICFILLQSNIWAQDGKILFQDTTVHRIDIDFVDLNSTWRDTLEASHLQKLWYNTTRYFPATITLNQSTIVDSVGVRYKGDYSFSSPRKPFKLDFNEFIKGQRLDGLKKLNIQGAAGDESLLHDKMVYDGLKFVGAAAPRTGFAEIYVNGQREGIFTLVEQVDSKFLKHNFGHKEGTLYKAFYTDFELDHYKRWEGGNSSGWDLKTNEAFPSWGPIDSIRAAVANLSDAQLSQFIRDHFDTEQLERHLAMELVTVSYDNWFSGGGANMYLWYDSLNQTYQTIPWDYNLSLNKIGDNDFMVQINSIAPDSIHNWDSTSYDYNRLGSKRFTKTGLFKSQETSNNIFQEICNIRDLYLDSNYIHQKIENFHQLLYPYASQDPYTNASEFEEGIDSLKSFFDWRRVDLDQRLLDVGYNCQASVALTDFNFSKSDIQVGIFDQAQADIISIPSDASYSTYVFEIEDNTVASISKSGTITPQGIGTTVVKAYSPELNITKTATLEVGTSTSLLNSTVLVDAQVTSSSFSSEDYEQIKRLRIVDLNGQVWFERNQLQAPTTHYSELNPGVYYLEYSTSEDSHQHQFLVK